MIFVVVCCFVVVVFWGGRTRRIFFISEFVINGKHYKQTQIIAAMKILPWEYLENETKQIPVYTEMGEGIINLIKRPTGMGEGREKKKDCTSLFYLRSLIISRTDSDVACLMMCQV